MSSRLTDFESYSNILVPPLWLWKTCYWNGLQWRKVIYAEHTSSASPVWTTLIYDYAFRWTSNFSDRTKGRKDVAIILPANLGLIVLSVINKELWAFFWKAFSSLWKSPIFSTTLSSFQTSNKRHSPLHVGIRVLLRLRVQVCGRTRKVSHHKSPDHRQSSCKALSAALMREWFLQFMRSRLRYSVWCWYCQIIRDLSVLWM